MASPAELINKAIFLHQQGNLVDAEAVYKKVLHVDAKNFDALHMLGIINAQRGAFQKAEELLRKALSIDPKAAPCFHNYGTVLAKLKRFEDAVGSYNSAIKLAPKHAPIYSDRGNALFELGCYDEALVAYNKALALKPNFPDAWVGRGNVFFKLKRHDEALSAYDQAIALKPDFVNAWLGRGNVLNERKRHELAASAYAKVLEIEPQHPFTKGLILHQKMLACDWKEIDRLIKEIDSDVSSGKRSAEPFGYQAIAHSALNFKLCAEAYTADKFPRSQTPLWRGDRYDNSRIRIGYLSGEFRTHVVSGMMAGLFELHDKNRFEFFAFDNGWDDGSELRGRINKAFNTV